MLLLQISYAQEFEILTLKDCNNSGKKFKIFFFLSLYFLFRPRLNLISIFSRLVAGRTSHISLFGNAHFGKVN